MIKYVRKSQTQLMQMILDFLLNEIIDIFVIQSIYKADAIDTCM